MIRERRKLHGTVSLHIPRGSDSRGCSSGSRRAKWSWNCLYLRRCSALRWVRVMVLQKTVGYRLGLFTLERRNHRQWKA